MMMDAICSTHASTDDIDFITAQINQETLEYGEACPFAFLIKDSDRHIIAGANGSLIYGAIYTDQLWVQKDHRGQGIARTLMEKVHALGRHKGCTIATIQTMSFQGAYGFYKKLGYTEDFRRDGYTHGESCIFMKKILLSDDSL